MFLSFCRYVEKSVVAKRSKERSLNLPTICAWVDGSERYLMMQKKKKIKEGRRFASRSKMATLV